MPVVLGVDSSTQSTKVEARDLATGRIVGTGRAAHPPTTPPVSEQDPEAWWSALGEAVAQLGPVAEQVAAVAVGGQQHGLVVLDANGAPLRPAKLWNDTTSAPNAEALVTALGARRWADGCGSVPVAAFTVAKLAWLAEHEPAVVARTARIMLPHDYLTWRLTGEHVTDRGDASGTGWFDPATDRYDA
ncbi:MAG: FGGY family carbohydrate kinase, partial [Actinomycetota bacterium]